MTNSKSHMGFRLALYYRLVLSAKALANRHLPKNMQRLNPILQFRLLLIRGKPADTAVFLQCPLPRSSLLRILATIDD